MLKKIEDTSRFIGSVIYGAIGILILFVPSKIFGSDFIFYNSAVNGFGNYPRLIWCVACVFFGFALIAYRASLSPHKNGAFPHYYSSYLLVLTLCASIDFGFFHVFKQTSNYLFYFLSGPMGFLLGYHADQAMMNPLKLLSILKPN